MRGLWGVSWWLVARLQFGSAGIPARRTDETPVPPSEISNERGTSFLNGSFLRLVGIFLRIG